MIKNYLKIAWRNLIKNKASSFIIAIPLAYYFLHSWLQNYEYPTKISWWVFVEAGTGAVVITLLTASFQAVKIALAGPAKSLRTE